MKKTVKSASVFVLAVIMCATMALAAGAESLMPIGGVIGIEVDLEGVSVSETRQLQTAHGKVSPAADAGIKAGDIITAVNGRSISSSQQLSELIQKAQGESVILTVKRGQEIKEIAITPAITDDGAKIGVVLKDKLTGIGTVTYYNPETGEYGALGHSISESPCGEPMPIENGDICRVRLTNIVEGEAGNPGQLQGLVEPTEIYGTVENNTRGGIFGYAEEGVFNAPVYETAPRSEVKVGKATILSDISGKLTEYDVEISRIYPDNAGELRGMMIKICDEDLLELTNGIVQGMSGSPIIQNGKLIGAVTHVLVNDPSRGYGIFIDNMLDAAG